MSFAKDAASSSPVSHPTALSISLRIGASSVAPSATQVSSHGVAREDNAEESKTYI